ncbi:MAG: sulfite exporter TauE/SafE family protein [Clostridia bacterium]|nr:sulfite exporter TauE/SafE family protein [Clostridia bacterium]
MKILSIIIISTFSGIFAGMGMGGGTFLIPLLSLLFGYNQAVCQSTNVICFFIYKKNKLIDFKILILVSTPACVISTIFTYFSVKIDSSMLKTCFSIFIVIFGLIYFVKSILNIIIKLKISKKY